MRGLIFCVLVLLFSSQTFADEWRDLEDEKHLRELFINHSDLTDPFSVQFRGVRILTDGKRFRKNTVIYCGQSNQKNQMGGYIGWAPFYAMEAPPDNPTVKVAIGDAAAIIMVGVDAFCTNR